ncbi:glycosyltransferase family 2 protein [Chryseobacterium indologenes]|uniref:glycosyltransferase family 2 protein n=1 Tax=Chryseobacterium indologenes TaxID=253 RepID=UPI000786F52E|nr:glycosyltransferase [Chryseobacterium indologenes]
MSKISILIANYNNGHFFKECFDSLIAQTFTDWEAVILDDASKDNSLELIKNIIQDDCRFKIYTNETNKGVGYTKRRLVELSNSEICGFLDPDDALVEEALEIVFTAHSENPDVGLIYSNFIFCDHLLNKIKVHKATQINDLDEKYLNFNAEISHFATFKKSVYNKTSGIDTYLKMAEDKDWYMKICEVAPVKHIDKDLYLYRIHGGGISNKSENQANYWHWLALIKMAERRNIDIESLFLENFVRRKEYDKETVQNNNLKKELKQSRWIKLGHLLGFCKFYKHL